MINFLRSSLVVLAIFIPVTLTIQHRTYVEHNINTYFHSIHGYYVQFALHSITYHGISHKEELKRKRSNRISSQIVEYSCPINKQTKKKPAEISLWNEQQSGILGFGS